MHIRVTSVAVLRQYNGFSSCEKKFSSIDRHFETQVSDGHGNFRSTK